MSLAKALSQIGGYYSILGLVLTALVIANRYLLNKELKKEIGPDARIEQVYSFEAMRELGIEMKELKKTVEKLQRKSNHQT